MYKVKTISYDSRVRIFWTLIIFCLASLVLYIYAINSTVHNTVARQTLESEASKISTNLGEMEYEYISLKNKVSLEVAYARGFSDVKSPSYISRAAKSLSMNTLRR